MATWYIRLRSSVHDQKSELTLTELLCELLHLLLVGLGLLCDRLRVPDGLHARVVRADLVLRRLVHLVPLNGMEINMNEYLGEARRLNNSPYSTLKICYCSLIFETFLINHMECIVIFNATCCDSSHKMANNVQIQRMKEFSYAVLKNPPNFSLNRQDINSVATVNFCGKIRKS